MVAQATVLSVAPASSGPRTRMMVLEQAGYRVLRTASLGRALEVFLNNQVDAVLVEAELAVLGALREMKRAKPQVPVVLVSAPGMDCGVAADGFFIRGDPPSVLLAMLSAMLRPRANGMGEASAGAAAR